MIGMKEYILFSKQALNRSMFKHILFLALLLSLCAAFLLPAAPANAYETEDKGFEVIWPLILKTRGGCNNVYDHRFVGITNCAISQKVFPEEDRIDKMRETAAKRLAYKLYEDTKQYFNGRLRTWDQQYMALLAILETGQRNAVYIVNKCDGKPRCIYIEIAKATDDGKQHKPRVGKDCISCRMEYTSQYMNALRRYHCIPDPEFGDNSCKFPTTMTGRGQWSFTKDRESN